MSDEITALQEMTSTHIHPDVQKQYDHAGATIIETSQDYPKTIDPAKISGLPEDVQMLVTEAFNGYVDFLSRPIVTDKFQVHQDRAKWRETAGAALKKLDTQDGDHRLDQFTQIYKNNRLNINSLMGIPGHTDLVSMFVSDLPADFPASSLDRLVTLSKRFTTTAQNFQEYIANPNPWDSTPLIDTRRPDGTTKPGKLSTIDELEKEILTIVNYLGAH